MQLIFLVIQVILAVAIIGAILLQKNGGDGLGSLGGGSGISGHSIISGRTSANFLSKATSFLMICFVINCLILGNMAVRQHNAKSVVERALSDKSVVEEKAIAPQVPTSE